MSENIITRKDPSTGELDLKRVAGRLPGSFKTLGSNLKMENNELDLADSVTNKLYTFDEDNFSVGDDKEVTFSDDVKGKLSSIDDITETLSKNLEDGFLEQNNLVIETNIFKGYTGSVEKKMISNNDYSCIYIPCKPSTKYTIKKTKGVKFAVGTTSTVPANDVELNTIVNVTTLKVTTHNTTANDKYLVVYMYSATQDTYSESEIIKSITIVEGTLGKSNIELTEELSSIGTKIETTDLVTTIENNKVTKIGTLSLPKGVWFVNMRVSFQSNPYGIRGIALLASASNVDGIVNYGDTRNALDDYNTTLNLRTITTIDPERPQRFLMAYQNSGSELTLSNILFNAYKISNV